MALIWGLILMLLFAGTALSQPVFPDQPEEFQNRPSNPKPFLVYSFRQSVCAIPENLLYPDLGAPLPISRLENATSCPNKGTPPEAFQNAMIGYTVTNENERNAIMSAAIDNSFEVLNVDPGITGRKKMSIEIWFSSTSELKPNKEFTLVEIGSLAIGEDAPDANNGHQLKVTYKKLNNEDLLTVQYLYRTPSGNGDTHLAIEFVANDFGKLEEVGTETGKVFMLIMSIASTNDVTAFLGDLGGTLSNKIEERSGEIRRFVFPNTSRIRVGCTRTNDTRIGFPGSIHFLAFYNDTIDEDTATDLLNAGLPNSLPAVTSTSFKFDEDVGGEVKLNVTNTTVYDFDGDGAKRFRILTLPDKGRLMYNGQNITEEGFKVEDASLLEFINVPDEFSSPSEVPCLIPYTWFTFDASDGLCDHTTTQQNLSDPNCNSPVPANATICVTETNDAPDIVDPEDPFTLFTVFAEANNSHAFSITCRDRDNDTAKFGLSHVVLINQSNPELGKIYIVENGTGDCDGGTLIEDFEQLEGGKIAVNMSNAVGKNEDYTWHFCYIAAPTAVTTVHVGNDTINYECVDHAEASTPGKVHLAVKNAIIAGCGNSSSTNVEWAEGIPCTVTGMEDEPMFITLNGMDAVSSHIPERRWYKIVSLPYGTLKMLNGTNVTSGQELRADLGDTRNVTGIEGVSNYTTTKGNLTLVYYPAENHYTAICCLNRDPNNLTSVERHATCPSGCGTWPQYLDALGKPFNSCTNPAGCPVTFSFAIGYMDDIEGENVLSFSETLEAGFQITILGVNDPVREEYIHLPVNLTLSRVAFNFPLNNFTKDIEIGYFDPDGDTFRVGFHFFSNKSVTAIKVPEFDNPFVTDDNRRLTWHDDSDFCRDSGENCRLRGKAYMSDLNRMLNSIILSTAESGSNSNDALIIRIYDPVFEPYEFDPLNSFSVADDFIEKSIVVSFGSSAGSDLYGLISAALWAGIGAGLFFVAMACLAFWGCIISRAKRGEEAAVWAVKNLLCTDVEHRNNVDLSKMATGGRKSLEHAIHAEHARLARIVCCALFMHKVCPCLVKFDGKDLKVPDEESMLQEAVNQTRKRIASLHRPKDSPDGPIPVAKPVDPDVEDVVKEDELADDSIFDWERHLDDKTGRVFYYNIKTHESRWKPPTVKVHEQRKITDRTSVRGEALFQPKPPDAPKNNGSSNDDDADADRVKKAS